MRIFLLSLLLFAFVGCNKNDFDMTLVKEEDLMENVFETATITKLSINGPFKVTLTYAQEEKLTIETNAYLKNKIHYRTIGAGNELYIKLKDTDIAKGSTLNITLSLPSLHSVTLSSGCSATVEDDFVESDMNIALSGASSLNFEGNVSSAERFTCYLSGASLINFTNLDVTGSCDFNLSGASSATIRGGSSEGVSRLTLSGASSFSGREFLFPSLKTDLSGASSGTVYVTESLDVTLSGASNLKYKPGSSTSVNLISSTGASTLTQID